MLQREHTDTHVSSSIPKAGHSATITEYNIIYTYIIFKLHRNWPQKQATEKTTT